MLTVTVGDQFDNLGGETPARAPPQADPMHRDSGS